MTGRDSWCLQAQQWTGEDTTAYYEELGLLYLAQHFAPTFYGVGPS
jgi:hypothetical protein